MRAPSHVVLTLAALVASAAAASLSQDAVLEAVHRSRRDAECVCPPPPPPPPVGEEVGPDGKPLPPPMGPDGKPLPPGCPPMRHMGPRGPGFRGPYGNTPCDLRRLFRFPETWNMTARMLCFDKWERPAAIEMGYITADMKDMRAKPNTYRPTFKWHLMWSKGCEAQCSLFEAELLKETDDTVEIDMDGIRALVQEEGDGEAIATAIDTSIKTCTERAAELVHPKQICKSGADEFLHCMQWTLSKDCPGAKWTGNHDSCDELEDAEDRVMACRPHGPHGPRGPHGPGPKHHHAPSLE